MALKRSALLTPPVSMWNSMAYHQLHGIRPDLWQRTGCYRVRRPAALIPETDQDGEEVFWMRIVACAAGQSPIMRGPHPLTWRTTTSERVFHDNCRSSASRPGGRGGGGCDSAAELARPMFALTRRLRWGEQFTWIAHLKLQRQRSTRWCV